MKVLTPEYFSQFVCCANECPNTCCYGWNIDIDESSMKRYLHISGEIGEKLKRNIDHKNKRFRLHDGACPFLEKSGLCEIHSKFGPEALCYTCQTYPRERRNYNDLVQLNLSISCPEVAKNLICNKKMITFLYEECDSLSIRASKIIKGIPIELFDLFFSLESISIDILQHREVALHKRLLANSLMIAKIQSAISEENLEEARQLVSNYSSPDYRNIVFGQLKRITVKDELYVDIVFKLLDTEVCRRMMCEDDRNVVIYNNYVKGLSRNKLLLLIREYEQEFETYMQHRSYEYENYYVYMIYELFLSAIPDKDIHKVNVMMNVGFTLIKIISIFTWIDQGKVFSSKDHALVVSVFGKSFLHGDKCFTDAYQIVAEKKLDQLSYQAALIRTNL